MPGTTNIEGLFNLINQNIKEMVTLQKHIAHESMVTEGTGDSVVACPTSMFLTPLKEVVVTSETGDPVDSVSSTNNDDDHLRGQEEMIELAHQEDDHDDDHLHRQEEMIEMVHQEDDHDDELYQEDIQGIMCGSQFSEVQNDPKHTRHSVVRRSMSTSSPQVLHAKTSRYIHRRSNSCVSNLDQESSLDTVEEGRYGFVKMNINSFV